MMKTIYHVHVQIQAETKYYIISLERVTLWKKKFVLRSNFFVLGLTSNIIDRRDFIK